MYSIGEFAKKTGITIQTLRDWDKSGKLKPAFRSVNSRRYRYYSEEQLNEMMQKRINIGYIRVSAKHQKDDLIKQYELMEIFLTKQDKEFKIIEDVGSNMDYNRKGLREILKFIATNRCDNIFILHRDALLKFGRRVMEEFAKLHDTKIVTINESFR